MATFTKYNDFLLQLHTGIHVLTAAGNVVKNALHSDAPVAATDDEAADLTQVTGTGYTALGADIQNDISQSAGTLTATAVDNTWTAGAGDWIAARYASTLNDTSTNDKLINSWDYGANFTLANTETFMMDYGASWFTDT